MCAVLCAISATQSPFTIVVLVFCALVLVGLHDLCIQIHRNTTVDESLNDCASDEHGKSIRLI